MNKNWIRIIAFDCYKWGLNNGSLGGFHKLFDEAYKRAGGKE